MTWSDGDQWTLALELPPGHHEFKMVAAATATSYTDWEGGPNRALDVSGLWVGGGFGSG